MSYFVRHSLITYIIMLQQQKDIRYKSTRNYGTFDTHDISRIKCEQWNAFKITKRFSARLASCAKILLYVLTFSRTSKMHSNELAVYECISILRDTCCYKCKIDTNFAYQLNKYWYSPLVPMLSIHFMSSAFCKIKHKCN